MSDDSRVEKNLAEAVRWLTEAAKQQDLYAKEMLGEIYSSHDFDKRDDSIAAQWFSEVARSDDSDKELMKEAQYHLGMLLYQECTGYLISLECGTNKTSPYKNYQFAARWFERAAKQGHRDAQFQVPRLPQRNDVRGPQPLPSRLAVDREAVNPASRCRAFDL
jgi:TPR repeat protein